MTVDEIRKIYALASDYALAKKLGVSRQSVSKWRGRGWIPVDRAKTAEKATGATDDQNANAQGIDTPSA